VTLLNTWGDTHRESDWGDAAPWEFLSRDGAKKRGRSVQLGNGSRRIRILVAILCLGLLAFGSRLVQIQVIEAPALAAAAAESRAREVLLPGKRGDILDRNGAPLATSVDARDITVDQTLITDPEATALQLMPILQMKKKDLIKILTGTLRGKRSHTRAMGLASTATNPWHL
jgi:cell division protein FtsI/penicillin-binding protein 2